MKKTDVLVIAVLLLAVMAVSSVIADNFKPYPAPLKGKKIAIGQCRVTFGYHHLLPPQRQSQPKLGADDTRHDHWHHLLSTL